MRKVHQSLSEKERRKYAAIEALKLGHGGISVTVQGVRLWRTTPRRV